jgi:ribonuclease H / adenosylcobalamin/alpha-ribazole phosphatase
VAEYRGVIAGLEQALALGARRARVRADSLLVVNQQTGRWKVKNEALRARWAETRRLVDQFERVTWEHVPRERNRRADALANQAMDAQGMVEPPGPGPAANLIHNRRGRASPRRRSFDHAGGPLPPPSQLG